MNFNQYIRKLQSVHIAMVAGATLLGLSSYFILKPSAGVTNGQSLFVMIGSSVSIFFLMLFTLLQKQKIHQSSQLSILKEKFISFQNAYVMILSLLLGPAIMNFMLYGVGGPTFNFALGIVFTCLLATRFINKERCIDWLKIDSKQAEKLNDSKTSVFS